MWVMVTRIRQMFRAEFIFADFLCIDVWFCQTVFTLLAYKRLTWFHFTFDSLIFPKRKKKIRKLKKDSYIVSHLSCDLQGGNYWTKLTDCRSSKSSPTSISCSSQRMHWCVSINNVTYIKCRLLLINTLGTFSR